jgi:glutathione-regulated potassium-efflux system protein KefB
VAGGGTELLQDAAIYMAAAVAAVPIFKRLKLGSVLGYLSAGLVIGPFGLAFISDGASVLTFAEFGVVLLLFVIGLELRPARLWAMRREIFGLGSAQVLATGLLVAAAAYLFGLALPAAIIAGFALALSSTAFALQILKERNALATPTGETAFSILLLQDLAIIPLLALVAFLSPIEAEGARPVWQQAILTLSAIAGLLIAGRFGLPELFRLIAATNAREVLTAAALLVVVGSALLMASIGISMALGAFLAGVMLADSEFRHQLEADIEPFRSLLLGLFFIAVGMTLNLAVVAQSWSIVLLGVAGLIIIKAAVLIGLLRAFGESWAASRFNAALLSQGGEFGFVIFTTAAASQILTAQHASILGAIVTLSMAATPLLVAGVDWYEKQRCGEASIADSDVFGAHSGTVIVVGIGRIGQVVSQMLMARGITPVMIDSDAEQIAVSRQFGNRVYFGDGRRLDILRAAGAENAQLLVLAVDGETVDAGALASIREAFPNLQVIVRAFDRRHAMALMKAEADVIVRETYESAIVIGKEALRRLNVAEDALTTIEDEYRRRDAERLAMQSASNDIFAGRNLIFNPENPMVIAPVESGPSDAPGTTY